MRKDYKGQGVERGREVGNVSSKRICGVHKERRKRGNIGPCRWSDARLGMSLGRSLGNWNWKTGRTVRIIYLVPWLA